MHFIVDKYDPDEANIEQAKLMLWLEVEQYLESASSVPDGDFTDHAHRILRKFFRPDSNFSLIVHVPNSVRSAMLTALALAEEQDQGEGHGGRSGSGRNTDTDTDSGSGHRVYREAQAWAAEDLQGEGGSFSKFCSSRMCARMCGHLRCETLHLIHYTSFITPHSVACLLYLIFYIIILPHSEFLTVSDPSLFDWLGTSETRPPL